MGLWDRFHGHTKVSHYVMVPKGLHDLDLANEILDLLLRLIPQLLSNQESNSRGDKSAVHAWVYTH